jgi:hypothetical protein
MNSLLPDNDTPHMPMVFCVLKDLAVYLTILERRPTTSLVASSRLHPHLPNIAKESNFPPSTTTISYRLPKTDGDGSEKGKERLEREET